jgi:hypothetical protein
LIRDAELSLILTSVLCLFWRPLSMWESLTQSLFHQQPNGTGQKRKSLPMHCVAKIAW